MAVFIHPKQYQISQKKPQEHDTMGKLYLPIGEYVNM